MSDDLPEQLGRYRILRRLGTGGMAEVFLAKSTGAEGIEKLLVLKRVLPSFARSAKFISMFVDEAKVAMRLNHPNIVQVYAFEQVGREFLLAMELVDGLDLGRLVAATRRSGKRLPYGLCAYLAQEIAKGLHYAHQRKDEAGVPMEIVHRDVSPQNVLLTYDGVVKVGDFGIAKARMVTEETGVIKGKFSYMSPEQARGERVDARSDVYSLGVVLAELLMGRPMYPGIHGLDVLEKVRAAELTLPSQVDPNVPRGLERIVRRATAPDRDDRYASARIMSGALTQFLHTEEQVWDGEGLETFIQEIAPREATSPEARRGGVSDLAAGATLLSDVEARELRERRRVVIVASRLRAEGAATGAVSTSGEDTKSGEVSCDDETVKVLESIAYKNDAVLSWPDGLGRGRFRFIVGLGKASVNDPLKATRLAIDASEALQSMSQDALVPVAASCGMSRGIVSVVRDPNGRLLRYAPVGNVLEVAERLADAAPRSEVLVSGEIHRLIRRDFAFEEEEVREVDVRTEHGSAPRSIKAWLLRGARTQKEREAARAVEAMDLVGRDDELEMLGRLYAEIGDARRTQFAAVVGPLGVGKTSLVRRAIASFDPAPTVLRAECGYGGADVPFGAVTALIQSALGDDDGPEAQLARLEELLGRAVRVRSARRDDVATLVHAVRPLFGLAEPVREGEGDRSGMIRRALELLVSVLAHDAPVVVWLDALQWADGPSLELLGQMRQRTYDARCLVVMASRSLPSGGIDERLMPVFRSVPWIELKELAPEATRTLVRARFGAQVPEDVLHLVENRAGGNPFFVVELVDALLERQVVRIEGKGPERRIVRKPGVPIALPTTLEGVVAARLDELGDRERQTLRWLAVAGSGLKVDDLTTLMGVDTTEALVTLEKRGLVHVGEGGGFAFPNAVVRQVAYEATDLDDRSRIHRRIAQHLAAHAAPVGVGRVARHLEQAGERSAAAKAYLEAATAALAVYSNRDALRFYGKALELLSPEEHDARFSAHEGREQILRFLGRPHEQLRELEAMRALAERGGGPRRRAVALLRMARFDLDNARTGEVDELVPQALASARAAGDPKLEIDGLRLEAELARDRGEPDRGLEACRVALERAGTTRELLSSRAAILVQKGILLRRLGRSDEAFEAYAEAIVIFRRLGIRRNEAFALNSLGVALAANGAYEDAITAFRASIHIDRETGDRLRLGRKLSNVGQLYDALGDTRRGLSFVKRALDVFEAVDDKAGRCDAYAAEAEMMLDEGSPPASAALPLDQARRIAERLSSNYEIARERIVRARLERLAGDAERAKSAAREALEAARAERLVSYEVHALAELAAAHALAGDREDALTRAREARERLAGIDVERPEKVYRLLAELFASLGEEADAHELFDEAFELLDAKARSIRSDTTRARFLDSRDVRAIREGARA
ncbi:MAG: protein kinase [Myxococcota bacterium]|jgi:serine/threonine protein kinase/tetratricopeptide (TPR) repeat protein|nr:protein kinase [Myxococcota bacterium]